MSSSLRTHADRTIADLRALADLTSTPDGAQRIAWGPTWRKARDWFREQVSTLGLAVHTDAADARDTDWSQVAALHDQLVRLDPSPVVALNRAIAVAELDGPHVALAQVDALATPLGGYHAFHATRADLLRRLGRSAEAREAYDRAISLSGNSAEMAYLTRRRDQLASAGGR